MSILDTDTAPLGRYPLTTQGEDGEMFNIKMSTLLFLLPATLLNVVLAGVIGPIGETGLVSVSSAGLQGNGSSDDSFLSADGRYVVFYSDSNNLVARDTNNKIDIFVHDRLTRQTTRVSVNSAGVQGNGHSFFPHLSADGRYVAFASEATNLIEGGTSIPFSADIFVHDLLTRQTTRVSVNSVGRQGNSRSAYPVLSADGRFVAFYSNASNLVADDTNGASDIFLHDRLTHQTSRVSVNSTGVQANGRSYNVPSLSSNGRYVAFNSDAANLVEGDTNNRTDIFVHDRLTRQTARVSLGSSGVQGNGNSFRPHLSADGRYVAFDSDATNLVEGDTNNRPDIFVHDRLTQQTIRISMNSAGVQGNGESYNPQLSSDGRFVTFYSYAANLVAGDNNDRLDVFVRDRLTRRTIRVSVNTDGTEGNWHSFDSNISGGGRYVTFSSNANNLTANDISHNRDIFVRDIKLASAYQTDLAVAVVQKPTALTVGSVGRYHFSITNNGPEGVGAVRLLHIISNGQVLSLTSSQGDCRRYVSISLCEGYKLQPGERMTLTAEVKAVRSGLQQQVNVVNGGKAETTMANNYLTVATPVTLP